MPLWPLPLPPGQKPQLGAMIQPSRGIVPPPVGAWLLNDGAGAQAWDSSGNGNHGVLSGGVTYQGTPYGGGADFPSTGVITVPHRSSLNTTSELTMLTRIKRRSVPSSYPPFIAKGTGTYNYYLSFNSGTQQVYWTHNDGGWDDVKPGLSILANVWSDIGISVQGLNIDFWVAGQTASSTMARPMTTNTNVLTIGTAAMDCQLEFVIIGNSYIGIEGMRRLFSDPFALWRPSPQWWYAAAGGAVPFLAALTGGYAQRLGLADAAATAGFLQRLGLADSAVVAGFLQRLAVPRETAGGYGQREAFADAAQSGGYSQREVLATQEATGGFSQRQALTAFEQAGGFAQWQALAASEVTAGYAQRLTVAVALAGSFSQLLLLSGSEAVAGFAQRLNLGAIESLSGYAQWQRILSEIAAGYSRNREGGAATMAWLLVVLESGRYI
jgi:hypothetical protein